MLFCQVNHNVPIKSVVKTAAHHVMINCKRNLLLFFNRDKPQLVKSGVSTQPNIYPAVGPKKTENPPRPPDKTGNPNAASNNNSKIDQVPRFVPSINPARITPKFCKTIGTGMIPSGIPGMIPRIIKIDVIKAILLKSLVFKFLPPYC